MCMSQYGDAPKSVPILVRNNYLRAELLLHENRYAIIMAMRVVINHPLPILFGGTCYLLKCDNCVTKRLFLIQQLARMNIPV